MKNIVQLFKRLFPMLILSLLVLSMLKNPQVAASAGRSAVRLCLSTIVPTLLPFFVCGGLLVSLGAARLCSRFLSPVMQPLFRVPGCGALSFVLGTVCGFPMGAACAAELYSAGECSKTQAERLTAFCNSSSPLFVLGVVGGEMLSDPQMGVYLYLSHVLSALAVGFLFRFWGTGREVKSPCLPPAVPNTKHTARTLGSVFDNSVFSILRVCALVIFFSVVTALLPQSRITPFLHALLEITGGISSVTSLKLDPYILLPLISFFLAFSGVSVLMQVNAVISPCGLSSVPCFLGCLSRGVISAVLTHALLLKLPATKSAFAENTVPQMLTVLHRHTLLFALLGIALCISSVLLLCGASQLLKRAHQYLGGR